MNSPFTLTYSEAAVNGEITAVVGVVATDTNETLLEQRVTLTDDASCEAFAVQGNAMLRPLIGRRDARPDLLAALAAKRDKFARMPAIVTIGDIIARHPEQREPIIDGVARAGDVVNVIGGAKTRKSWLAEMLLLCALIGRPWLNTFALRRCGALLIDNELHPSDIGFRVRKMAAAAGIMRDQYESGLCVWSLRGDPMDVHTLCARLESVEPGRFGIIVIDALYRALPEGTSENDNAQVTTIYNTIARTAERLGAVVVIVHHSSKGVQGSKSVTDVGAGAGAFARAADAHLIIREHEEPDCVVLETVNRSFPPNPPIGLAWSDYQWHRDDELDLALIKTDRKPRGAAKVKDEKPPKPLWTPATFAERFATAEPQTEAEIFCDTDMAGLTGRQAKQLLMAAVAKGVIHRWEGRKVRPDRYATRAPELLVEVMDAKPAAKQSKSRKRGK